MNKQEVERRYESLDELKKIRFLIADTRDRDYVLSIANALLICSMWLFVSLAFRIITGIDYFLAMCGFIVLAELALVLCLWTYESKYKNKKENFLLKYGN